MTALLGLLTALVVAGLVSAATPVTAGYRDFIAGGGVDRPTADKPQSKLWFTNGTWFAGMFDTVNDSFKIYRLSESTHDWATGTGLPAIDGRNKSTGDYLWDEGSQTLWVASTHPTEPPPPPILPPPPIADDSLRVYRYSYNAGTNAYTAAGTNPAVIPDTTSVAGGEGGAVTLTIALDSGGRLWAVWPHSSEVRYSFSDDDGVTWSTPAQVPAQAGNSIKNGGTSSADVAAVAAFGSNIGILWSDHDNIPLNTDNGFYFTSIAAGADPTVGANWATAAKLPSLPNANDGERADNHINMKVASDGTIYAVGKTGKDTAGCATNLNRPLIPLFKRTTGGTWSVNLVSTVGDCNTRPQLVISEQLNVIYVLMTSPNGGGAIYVKSAPLTGTQALKFRTADTTLQPGTPFIKSDVETKIDDVTTTKQVVTSASGIVALANNIAPQPRYYLHNEMALGGAADTVKPIGTIEIDAGAPSTSDTVVSVAVPATDPGSGVSQVRLANVGTFDGNGVLSGAGATTFAYTTPIDWTVTSGDGSKTVYVQWRDGAGNWSVPINDTIIYDSVPVVGTVSIDVGATYTTDTAVSVDVTATDAGSSVDSVRLANVGTVDAGGVLSDPGAVTRAYATPQSWTLSAGDGTKTVYVQWLDGNGVWSPVQNDTIVLDATDPSGTVSINAGTAATADGNVSVAVPATDAGSAVANVRLANTNSVDGNGVLDGLGAATHAYATPQSWTLSAGDGTKTVYVQWQDGAGNWSVPVSDTIVLDTTAPVGSVTINGGDASTPISEVSVAVPATDASGVASVRLSNSPTTSGGVLSSGTTRAYASPQSWTLTPGDGPKTVYVQWQDGLGTWSAVQSDTITLDSVDTTYTAIAPVRLLDSRFNNPAAITMFRHAVPQSFQISGRGGIPDNAVAVTANLTVTGQGAKGFVTLGPDVAALPTTSTINFPLADNRANGVFVPLDGAGRLEATYRAGGAAATTRRTHLVLDVTGYFVAGAAGNEYATVTPARYLDTRVSNPAGARILSPGVPYGFRVGGRTVGGTTVPADAVAITGNLTVTGQTRGGFLSLTPTAQSTPTTSTLNFPVGDTRANNVTVKLGAGGNLYVVYKGTGRAHAILDVTGYFRNDPAGLSYVPLTPTRTVDTRIDLGLVNPLRANVPGSFTVRGVAGVASDAAAFTANVTIVGQTRAGFVSVTPTPTSSPTTSTINFPLGDVRANGIAAKLDAATGKASAVFKASSGRTEFIVDVNGYFH